MTTPATTPARRPVTRARRLRNFTLFVLAVLLVLILGVIIFATERQAHILIHPNSPSLDQPISNAPLTDARQAVSFTTSDGLTLGGWYIPSKNGAAVIFVHGLSGNRTSLTIEASLLIEQGYGALLFDLRNHGGNPRDSISTMGLHEVRDVQAAFAFVVAQPDVDPTRIALYGASMGGVTAIRAMRQLPTARALLLDTAYTDTYTVLADGVQYFIPFLPRELAHGILGVCWLKTGIDYQQIDTISDIRALAGRPIFMMYGLDDTLIPPHHIESLYAAASEPKALYAVSGTPHGAHTDSDPAAWAARVVPFLAEHLRAA
jgi:uncharacterized protein